MEETEKRNKIQKVADILRDEISDIHLKHGQRISSATDIARRLNVSTPTVHAAEKILVREGLLYRIQGSGTYIRKDGHSKRLSIGLLESDVIGPVAESMHQAIKLQISNTLTSLRSWGYTVQLFPYQELLDEKSALEKLKFLDGVLISRNYVDPYTLELLKKTRKPFVIFRQLTEYNFPVPQVCIDLLPGMRLTLKHVRKSEIQNPVIFCEPHSWNVAYLWKQALMEQGVSGENIQIVELDSLSLANECYRYVRVYCRKMQNTMIFTTQDGIAANLISALTLEDMHPGRDYRLVSCENRESQGFRFAPEPLISSVYAPVEKVTSEAVKLLRYLIDYPTDCIHVVRIPAELEIRRSMLNRELL